MYKDEKKNTLKMTDEQHEIEKSDIFLFIRERKKKETKRDHYTSDRMFFFYFD
jgi:hypothetical protein